MFCPGIVSHELGGTGGKGHRSKLVAGQSTTLRDNYHGGNRLGYIRVISSGEKGWIV